MDGVSQLAFWEILESFYEFAIATGLLEEIQGSPDNTVRWGWQGEEGAGSGSQEGGGPAVGRGGNGP